MGAFDGGVEFRWQFASMLSQLAKHSSRTSLSPRFTSRCRGTVDAIDFSTIDYCIHPSSNTDGVRLA